MSAARPAPSPPLPAPGAAAPSPPTFAEAVRVWARVAALSFGGPAGQIAVMHRILVEERRWIGERRFFHALNFCMLLPGPEATQLAIYVGWLLHGLRGGLVAGTLFVLPGFLALTLLAALYATLGNVPLVQALFFGLKAAVLAIVLEAVVRIGRRALRNGVRVGLAVLAFLAIFALDLPFPLIVLGAGLLGFVGGRAGLPALLEGGRAGSGHREPPEEASVLGEAMPPHARPGRGRSLRVAGVLLALWLGPVLLLLLALGEGHVFARIALFMSQLAVVTFGGAYAVLAWVAQAAVETYGWLAPGEMLDGLGLAETTPGPLIMVLLFVGFLAAYRDPGPLDPMLAGLLGGSLATWVTFVPCFLWIFAAAPYVERIRGNRALAAALAAITAAVVGVVLNLALWFALHVLFVRVEETRFGPVTFDLPVLATWNPAACALSALALLAVFRFRLGLGWMIGGWAAMGLLLHALRFGPLPALF